jgi:predicted Rossmann fold nucleotide-binding protein DprA/Smf involved in DNA uptake
VARQGTVNRQVERIVSGGQTGVDRAALDVALEIGLPCGGWCPAGRLAEDGAIPDRYPLRETPSASYPERTARNVRDSDATLILYRTKMRGGTALTARLARHHGRPCLALEIASADPDAIRRWLAEAGVRVLNVAGPRESEAPGIHREATALLRRVLTGLRR